MEWFISHKSALEFWLKAQTTEALAGKRLRACKAPTKLSDTRGLRDKGLHAEGLRDSGLRAEGPHAEGPHVEGSHVEGSHVENLFGLSKPLHILVGDSNARKVTKSLRCHIDSRRFPGGSFIQVAPGVNMSSPELCFAQMANELTLIQLVLLGFELCGSYRLDNEGESERGFRNAPPLTNVTMLSSYIAKCDGLRGIKNARRALRFIADGSASPMETALTMLLTLPYKLGGYGFPLPLLNCPVHVPVNNRRIKAKSKYYCDIYWPDMQVDVEYDSDYYHTNDERIAKDAIRRNALSSVGVTVVTVSRMQINSTAELRSVAVVLGRLFNKQLKCPLPEFTVNHAALRNQVLHKRST